jgi:hypothetical protein
VIPTAVAVSFWNIEEGDEGRDFQAVVRITTPSGASNESTTNFRMVRPRHRVMNQILGIPVDGTGNVRFELLLNGRHVAEHIVMSLDEDVEVLNKTGNPRGASA